MPELPERTSYTVIFLKDSGASEDELNSGTAYTFELPPRVPRRGPRAS